jgi:hypothetical protein
MNDSELDAFEKELRLLRPSRPPGALTRQLLAAAPAPAPGTRSTACHESGNSPAWPFAQWFGWLAPTMAVLICGLFVWMSEQRVSKQGIPAHGMADRLRADDISVDQHLVSSFDAIAELPDGEPVRFQYREWRDTVNVRDLSRGVAIQRESPRIEVIPVRFETY